jgi:hypothetical protein
MKSSSALSPGSSSTTATCTNSSNGTTVSIATAELAGRVSNFIDERGAQLGPLFQLFDNLAIPASLEEALVPIMAKDDLKEAASFTRLIAMCNEAARDRIKFQKITPYLSVVEAAALLLYSADSKFYSMFNSKLRGQDRQQLKPFIRVIWLIMHALSKCPVSVKRHVYRGINADISADYPKGRTITWNAFSSCTTSLDILENEVFMGTTGPRTLFSLELTTNRGRVIAEASFHSNEEEVLLPPNSRFIIESSFCSADGLTILHLKELEPLDPILDFPTAPLDAEVSVKLEQCQAKLILAEQRIKTLEQELSAVYSGNDNIVLAVLLWFPFTGERITESIRRFVQNGSTWPS